MHRGTLKRRLLKENKIKNECSICGLSEWNLKPLTLVLDHINGINNDDRTENLRLLCPNCNSQTSTFCGRNIKKKRIINYLTKECPVCYKKFQTRQSRERTYCSCKCSNTDRIHPTKINWNFIDLNCLMFENEMNFSKVARLLGVSDASVHKHFKK